jgi:flagellar biosynthetic protein FliQ
MMADMPDDRMLATLARAGVMLFTQTTATFLVPVLVVAVVVGLIQTVLSVQESSLSFLPKLLTLVAVMAIAGEGVMRALGDLLTGGLLDMVAAIR